MQIKVAADDGGCVWVRHSLEMVVRERGKRTRASKVCFAHEHSVQACYVQVKVASLPFACLRLERRLFARLGFGQLCASVLLARFARSLVSFLLASG